MRRTASVLLLLFCLSACGATESRREPAELKVANVYNQEKDHENGEFGQAAIRGFKAAEEQARSILGNRIELVDIAINTQEGRNRPDDSSGLSDKAKRRVRDFLNDQGRIFFGGASTGETNDLLVELRRWTRRNAGFANAPILLFAPVSASILNSPDSGDWSNQNDMEIRVVRVAISDSQALQELLGSKLRLRYPSRELPHLSLPDDPLEPGQPWRLRNMAVFAQMSLPEGPAVFEQLKPPERSALESLRDHPLKQCRPVGLNGLDFESCLGTSMAVSDYVAGFLKNLRETLRRQAVDSGRLVFWQADHEATLSELRQIVDEVVETDDVQAVGIFGYAPFVRRINGLFVDSINESRGDRGNPEKLWRFTGGTVKLEHLEVPPDDSGSFAGLHFLRTIPTTESITSVERRILESIAAARTADGGEVDDAAGEVEDLSVHAYLGVLLVAHAADIASRAGSGTETARLFRALEQPPGPLEIPFVDEEDRRVRFNGNGDLISKRHVFYVAVVDDEHVYYQTDLATFEPPTELVVVLTLGFFTAVVVLVNWKRILGRTVTFGTISIANPYVYGVPVTRPEMYFGRRHSFRKLVEEIESGPFVLLITGGRRSGKSSFLHFVSQGGLPATAAGGDEVEVPSWVVPIYLDLQQLPQYPTEEEFLSGLLRRSIERAAGERGLSPDGFDDADGGNEYLRISHLLDEIHRRQPRWMILLLFDEIELLNDRVREGSLSRNFPRLVRAWVQSASKRICVVFTGSPMKELDEASRKLWEPVEGMMKTLNLGPLSEQETMDLVSRPVAAQVAVDEPVQRELYHLSGGQPFLCQAICHMAINALNIERPKRLPAEMTRGTLDAAVRDFVENTPGHVDDMWSRVEPQEQYLLLLMAKRIGRQRGVVALRELMAYAEREFEVEEKQPGRLRVWKQSVERLVQDRRFVAVTRDDPSLEQGQEGYYFVVDLMRQWLQRKSINPVIDQLRSGGGTP
jgi:hypothetical protein